ncbi:MAG: hypothetical protein ACXIUM_13270 [Wenzhouxiangella sp.]
MKSYIPWASLLVCLLLLSLQAEARPVSWPGGQVVIVDAQSEQVQWRYSYSQDFRTAFGVGGLYREGLTETGELNTEFLHATRLLWRRNQPASQANVFGWTGLGYGRTDLGSGLSGLVGIQADWESKRFYVAGRSEWHAGSGWSHRFNSLSFAVAPYEHDFDRIATWIVLRGMQTSRADSDAKAAVLLRFFAPRWWIEFGVDSDSKPLANLMFNF